MYEDESWWNFIKDFTWIAGPLIIAGLLIGGTALYAFIQWAVS